MYKVSVDVSGRVDLPHRVVSKLKTRELVVASSSEEHVLLATDGAGTPCLTAALGEVGVADVLSFFNMFRKTGVLYFDLSDGARQIYFQDGEIIFATSQRYVEDIGEILCEQGKVERSTLNEVRADMDSDAVLSQVLVRRNLVAARDLWLATRSQVESIVYNLFSCGDGGCYFVAQQLQRDDIVRLSMSTQNLIMEGLRRVDERALYLRKLRSLDSVITYTGKSPAGLDEDEKMVLSFVYSASATVEQLVARSGLSEFDGLRVVYQLADKKMIEIAIPADVPIDPALQELFGVFNGVLRLLFECLSGESNSFAENVNCFIREIPHPMIYVLRGVSLEKDGSVNCSKIVKNLSGLELLEQKKLMVEALNELVYMECTVARRVLGTQGSSELIRRVQEITNRAKSLVVGEG
ncbi:MAG: hypothetical protein B6I36_04350 [Desulfobacteraceae bacterium 4572_35.1]|nr:MAG: hypothetical protein B6I36_04350 [Desulfobacteraceae bacterium 4572_35.1]